MLKNLIASIPARPGSARVFLAVAATVAALVLRVRALVPCSAPRFYVGKVRIKLVANADNTKGNASEPNATNGCDPLLMRTECEVIRSELILAHVISAVGMNQTQGKRLLGPQGASAIPGRIERLRKRIEVRPIQNTDLIDVCVHSEDPGEAAQIANALVETYRAYLGNLLKDLPPPVSIPLKAQVIDRALPVLGPVQPNNLPGAARDALGAIQIGR